MFEQLGLIGCGLMGGSFALALKNAGLVQRVVGFSPSASSTTRALERGVIDAIAATPADAARGSDIVLIAVPVAATEATLRAIAPQVTPDMLIMDVGSTKSDVVQAATAALGDQLGSFVPAHPNTGKEVSGVAHADVHLYRGAKVILTPTATTLPAQLQRAQTVWQALGCDVRTMSPAQHDAAFAAVSHLPHLLAFAMMGSVTAQPQADAYLHLAGPGFRDFTRIAAGDASMWRDILLANKTEVLDQARQFAAAVAQLTQAIESGNGDALRALIAHASAARAQCHFNGPLAGTPAAPLPVSGQPAVPPSPIPPVPSTPVAL